MDATLKALDELLLAQREGVVPVTVTEQQPQIMDASAAAEIARQILSEPLVLSLPEGNQTAGPWSIAPADLAR